VWVCRDEIRQFGDWYFFIIIQCMQYVAVCWRAEGWSLALIVAVTGLLGEAITCSLEGTCRTERIKVFY
jgi:hypothetical protein